MTAVAGSQTARMFLATAAVALIALSGCSAANESPRDDSSGPIPAAEGSTEYPLTLETAWGETELSERPQRVAAIGPSARDVELLALLGVTPVAAPSTVERASWTLDALPGEIEEIYEGDADGITPHEVVAATQPDVIIAFGKDLSDEYDELSKIAPIVAAGDEEAATKADWNAELRAIAEALDLSDAADKAIDEHEQVFAKVRDDNPEFSGLAATYIIQYADSGLEYFSTPGSDTEELLQEIGFDPNPLAEEFADDSSISQELISQVDADVLVVGDNTTDEAELERLLTGTELFQGLDAVEQGRYVVISTNDDGTGFSFDGEEHEGNLAWALSRGGPLGKQFAAEHLAPMLQAALS